MEKEDIREGYAKSDKENKPPKSIVEAIDNIPGIDELREEYKNNEEINRICDGDSCDEISTETKYIAQYLINDGEWHGEGYDSMPIFAFYADNDEEAHQLALGYTALRKREHHREDCYLYKLSKLRVGKRDIAVDIKSEEGLSPDLEEKVKAAKFTPLKEAILPYE